MPDYAAAAEREAQGNLDLARYQTLANRPNINSPYGSRVWSQDEENPDQWTYNETLTPEQQRIFNVNQQSQQGMADLGLMSLGQLNDTFSNRFQVGDQTPAYQGAEGNLPAYGEKRQQVMDAMLGRVDTDIGRDRERKRAQLVAQGIPVGSEAYNREMEQLDRQLTDARQQAEINATDQAGREYASSLAGRAMQNQEGMDTFSTGMESHRQGVTDALLERQTPLNEMNAFRTGSQVTPPNFGGYGQMGRTQAPDYTGVTQNEFGYDMGLYNTDVARQNETRQGLLSLGSAFAASDIRLKHTLQQTGQLPSGLPVYEFSYIGSDDRYEGVMAQDVIKLFPEAVEVMDNGYYAVNYGMIH